MGTSMRRFAAGALVPALTFSLVSLWPSRARSEIVDVATSEELLAAIAAAVPGDEIVLAAGTYALGGASCTADGSEEQPITVRAASHLGAIIEMDALEGFKVSGAHWHFEDLEVRGVCASDPDCEHAFHVVGGAEGFWLRNSRVLDFNAQLKVNAQDEGAGFEIPHRGLIEGNDIRDTSSRETDSPTTKLNIDTGDDWIVRANVIADFQKNGGDEISYGAFMKSGGNRGLFERNLVMCTYLVQTGGTRIGLSFGGGGTGAQFCAPDFDPDVPCDPEHSDGVMRNNVIVNCSDVGIYLNLAANTRVLSNTLIGTAGIDFRFASTSGEADGNVLSGAIRGRDDGTFTPGTNVENVELDTFLAAYVGPLSGDLRVLGDDVVADWIGAGAPRADVPDDYCLRDRPAAAPTLGALEHSLGDCTTFPPPVGESSSATVGSSTSAGSGGDTSAGPGGPGAGPGSGGGDAGPGATSGTSAPGSASGGDGAAGSGGAAGDEASGEDDGCGCRVVAAAPVSRASAALALALAAAVASRRVRRRAARGAM